MTRGQYFLDLHKLGISIRGMPISPENPVNGPSRIQEAKALEKDLRDDDYYGSPPTKPHSLTVFRRYGPRLTNASDRL